MNKQTSEYLNQQGLRNRRHTQPPRRTQADLFAKRSRKYGGSLLKTRKGRRHGRPLSTQDSMHFVLKSSQATGDWSFFKHRAKIRSIVEEFAVRFGIQLNSMANVGNHLHIHLQLKNRHTYLPFIRAVSAAVMMAVTGISRWNKLKLKKKFWDNRPYSSIVVGLKALLNLRDYIRVNQYEGWGYSRTQARFMLAWDRDGVLI